MKGNKDSLFTRQILCSSSKRSLATFEHGGKNVTLSLYGKDLKCSATVGEAQAKSCEAKLGSEKGIKIVIVIIIVITKKKRLTVNLEMPA